ncbi:MAG TPA: peptidase [Peptococcaceae bacterium]|nr:peptidase [Peptococcaceae bacterium]
MPGLGAEGKMSGVEKPKITLEQAIQIVKGNFTVPPEYKEFTSGFSTYQDRQSWSLNWNAAGEKGGSFSAQVDALSGEILSIYSWKSADDTQGFKLPAKTVDEAKKIATDIVKKLTGSKYSQLKLLEDQSIIPLNFYGTPSYTFRWQRMANDIPVRGNEVNIQLNADNGQVISYSLAWDNLKLPDKDGVINAEKAAEVFSNNNMLELKYFLPPTYRILAAGTQEKVQLIYQLKANSLIDALSGKPLQLNQEQWLAGAGLAMDIATKNESSQKVIPLTPEEQAEIERNIKLLTQEQAIASVKKWLTIPAGFSLQSMNLSTDSSRQDTKVWSFEWASSEKDRGQTITARVDALNGELLGFNLYSSPIPLAENASQKPVLTKEEAQKIAEDFLKKIQPDKFKETRLKNDNSSTSAIIRPDSGTSLTFTYERTVNEIAFPANGISVTVDLLTKEITAYNLNWQNLSFPNLTEAMPKTQAEIAFLKGRPLVLTYIIVSNSEGKEAKLVYQPSQEGSVSDIMDAKTGSFLDWQGKPLNKEPKALKFTDISGHQAEKEITVLGLAGLFGEYGQSFKPENNLTVEAYLRALLMINNGASNYGLTPDEVLKKAQQAGWLKEDLTPSQNVSRELFCTIIVRYLGLEKIANLENIYSLEAEDADLLPAQAKGYVALATGLKIIDLKDNKLNPNQTVTRAEAARSIIRALSCGVQF